jgi:hypothetical protein
MADVREEDRIMTKEAWEEAAWQTASPMNLASEVMVIGSSKGCSASKPAVLLLSCKAVLAKAI